MQYVFCLDTCLVNSILARMTLIWARSMSSNSQKPFQSLVLSPTEIKLQIHVITVVSLWKAVGSSALLPQTDIILAGVHVSNRR